MKKLIKFSVFLCFILCFIIPIGGCGRKNEVPNQSNKQATINNVNYSSLTEAVENAKSGDTIKIYNDLRDNKNVTITKPLTIKGIVSSSQIKPRFYGSITIDLDGEQDTITIQDLEIIHKGLAEDGLNNNTTTGIYLINGGLTLKSNIIGLEESTTPNENASGVVITRSIDSNSLMPIIVNGNSFNNYNTGKNINSSALIVKSNKNGEFQKLNLNENELFNQNTFNTSLPANQFMYIDYSTNPFSYSFLVTSSSDNFIKTLQNYQDPKGCNLFYYPTQAITQKLDSPITILEQTVVTIDGNKEADFNNAEMIVNGSFISNTALSNAKLKKGLATSNITISNPNQNNIIIE